MIKKILFLSTLIFIMLLSGCSNTYEENKTDMNKNYLISTCPTTYEYLKKINIPDENIIQTESTAQALHLLNINVVQIAFVGRNSYPNEIKNDILRLELFNRNTIISKNDNPLSTTQLREITILTYLSEQEAREHQDLKLEFINKEDMHNYENNLFLVSWRDFDEHIQQGFKLVNIYDGINKLDSFRNPKLYYEEEFQEITKQIAQSIKQ